MLFRLRCAIVALSLFGGCTYFERLFERLVRDIEELSKSRR
jgi:hypothetical protein